ncbi:MAG: outer membrane lipoprotein carrier protein LolA [Acidobacteria bacterium]|nr:MAG: outer membrane lipoprotein carrier protein LolA [Acidobacteriota bacterium]
MSETASLLLVMLLLQAGPAPGPGSNPSSVIQAVEQKYAGLKSLSASFSQSYQNAEQRLEESGTLVLKKPGRMYWEYHKPTTKHFLVDGKKSIFYVPEDKQAIVSEIDLDDASVPLLLLFGRTGIEQNFQVSWETEEAPRSAENALVRLTPREPQGEFTHVLLEVTPSALVHRLTVFDPIGSRNDYVFSDIRENANVPDRSFNLKLPKDVELIKE